jgi:hypothetical protein
LRNLPRVKALAALAISSRWICPKAFHMLPR